MQRRLNLRLLFWTLGCLTALTLGVNLLHGFQVRRNAYALFQRGDQALAKQEFSPALRYLEQYLALAPDDIDAREKFDLALDKTARDPNDKVRVVLRIEDLLMRDPNRHAARERLVHNLIELCRFKDAILHLQFLLPLGRNEAETLHQLGWCQAVSGDAAAAQKSLTRAIERDPKRIASYLLLADVLQRRLGQDDEANLTIDNMVQANVANHQAYLARSGFNQQRGRLTDAAKDLQQALELAPKDADVLLAAATWAQSQGKVDEAQRHLRRGVELHPQNVAFVKALVDVEIRDGKRPEAMSLLRSGTASFPEAFDLQIQLADLLIDDKQLAEADQIIASLVRAGLPPTFPNYLQARRAIADGKWAQALGLLEKVRGILGAQTDWSSRVHAQLGACHAALGDAEQSLSAYQRAVAIEPSWTIAKHGLGLALLAAGRLDEALVELEAVGKASDAPDQVWASLAHIHLSATLRRPLALRDWTATENALAKAAAVDPTSVKLTLLRAELLEARNEPAEARAVLDRARTASKNVEFWAARSALDARAGNVADGLAILDEAARIFGETIEVRLARIQSHGHRGLDDDREALVNLAQPHADDTVEAKIRLFRSLAETWQRLGDVARSERLWRQVADVQPNDLRSRFVLMEKALQRGETASASKLIGELRKIEGESGNQWRFGEAALRIHESRGAADKLGDARRLVADLARRERDWSRVPLLEARIDELEGKWDRAIQNCLKAIELGERDPRLARRLVQQLLERRQYTQAEFVLLKLEDQGPLSPDLARLALKVTAANRNVARARQFMAQLFPTAPRDYRDLIWLGQIHAGLGEAIQAEALLHKAVQQASHVPDAWVALVEHLARTGQHAAAATAIAQMQAKMPAARLPLALARCWDAAGDPGRAAVAYRQALTKQPHDFVLLAAAADSHRRADQPEQAALYFQRLLDPGALAPPELFAWARRQLALCRMATGQVAQAAAIMEAGRPITGSAVADQRVLWFLEGQQPTRRKLAIQQFKESLGLAASTADEEMLLIQLLDAAGDAARAREQLAQLLLVEETPQAIAFQVRLLVKTESLSEALIWFAKLERWEPTSPRTEELRKWLLKQKDQV